MVTDTWLATLVGAVVAERLDAGIAEVEGADPIAQLVDLEDAFRLWRFRHVTTVQRIIGFKQGTGGTSGVGYLQAMLATELFPELWSIRTSL